VDIVPREGVRSAVRVRGIDGQNGSDFPCAQAHADIEHPDAAIGTWRLAQGDTSQGADRSDAHDRESHAPGDAGVRTRCACDAKGQRQEWADARDRTKATACLSTELQSHGDDIDLGPDGASVPPRLQPTQARLRRCEVWDGPIAVGSAARSLLTLGARALAARRGFVCPLSATVFPCGQLAHHVFSEQPDGPRPYNGLEVGIPMRPEPRTLGGVMHVSRPQEGCVRCHRTAQGVRMPDNRRAAKPIAGEHGRCCGAANAP
jgi:hypothetical protein